MCEIAAPTLGRCHAGQFKSSCLPDRWNDYGLEIETENHPGEQACVRCG
jgi:hypothetical protein